ncbi:MAG TPA: TolC family protein [Kofleriaceae bacterium]|jgi:outer membrane protein TolC
MRRLTFAVLAAVLLSASPAFAGPKLTLEEALQKALVGPKARMAQSDRETAEGKLSEADAARYPKIKLTGFITASPEIHCHAATVGDVEVTGDSCANTTPQDYSFNFDGAFGGGQIDVTQPLWTFGKIDHARKAARAGVAAQEALASEAAGDIAVDTAKAYWGAKVARELGYMLDDGIEQIQNAITKMNDDGGNVSVPDRQRVAVLLAQAKVQRADAKMAEEQALAGLRALVGVPDADIDDTEYAAVTRDVPKTASPDRRPQTAAAKAGATAADELLAMQSAYYWPDFALVGSGLIYGAQGADNPPSVFANDPYNRRGAGLVLALQWTVEPWTVHAKVKRAQAEAAKAHAQAALAVAGATYDAQSARAEADAAFQKVTAAAEGEKAARTWLASILQADAIGAAEPKDFADAYIAWFQMRAVWAQAVFQWNVGVVRLDRATGEFTAGSYRPSVK